MQVDDGNLLKVPQKYNIGLSQAILSRLTKIKDASPDQVEVGLGCISPSKKIRIVESSKKSRNLGHSSSAGGIMTVPTKKIFSQNQKLPPIKVGD